MKPNIPTVPPLPEPSEAEIHKIAYRLWVEGGCQHGVETDNWFTAKELLRHHHRADAANKPGKVAAALTSPLTGAHD